MIVKEVGQSTLDEVIFSNSEVSKLTEIAGDGKNDVAIPDLQILFNMRSKIR